jgi:hypothetical protein
VTFGVVDDLEYTHRFSAVIVEWNGQERIRSVPAAGVDAAIDFVGRVGAVPSPWLLTLEYRPGDPFVIRDAKGFALDSQCRMADQFAGRFVPEKDAGSIGSEQVNCGLGHVLQKPIEILMGVPAGSDFQDLIQSHDIASFLQLAMPKVDGLSDPSDRFGDRIDIGGGWQSMATDDEIGMGR